MSKQKVLFIVPHEDDEVFVGGPMILNLTQDPSYEVFVFIATNGDYYPFENGIRIKESLAGLKLMGVAKDKIFLVATEIHGKELIFTILQLMR